MPEGQLTKKKAVHHNAWRKGTADEPVLVFTVNKTRYEIYVAGGKEFIPMRCKDRHWSDNSIVVRRYDPAFGLEETESDLRDPLFWGWIGRIMSGDCKDRI